jgi:hypothetical protein
MCEMQGRFQATVEDEDGFGEPIVFLNPRVGADDRRVPITTNSSMWPLMRLVLKHLRFRASS